MVNQGRIHNPPWGICDVCGFKHPLKNLRKRWDGLKVCREDYETRHPQDFVRGVPDNQALHDPRPRPEDVFIDPFAREFGMSFTDADGNEYAVTFDDEDGREYEATVNF